MHTGFSLALDPARGLHGYEPLHWLLAGEGDNARKYAQLCLDITPTEDPFYLGYAHEAMARAELLLRNKEPSAENLSQARKCAEQVTDSENQKLLVNDLETLT